MFQLFFSDHPDTAPTYIQLRADIVFVFILLGVFNIVRDVFDLGKDATDSSDERSGMVLRTDYGTGCEYLETTQGYLIPRLSAQGNHLCNKE